MKILGKLVLAFVAVAALCGIVGAVGLGQLSRLERGLLVLSEETIPTIDYLQTIYIEFTNVKVAVRSLSNPLGAWDQAFYDKQLAAIAAARTRYRAAMAEFEKLTMVPEEKRRYDAVKAAMPPVAAYNDEIQKKAAAARGAAQEERDLIYADLYAMVAGPRSLAFDELLAALGELIAFDRAYYGKEVPAGIIRGAELGKAVVVGVTAAAFVLALGLGIALGAGISRKLRGASALLDRLAAGDIAGRLEIRGRDEFRDIARSLAGVSENIGALVAETTALGLAASDGSLSTRGDAERFQGGYRDIVAGMNATLDAVIGPLEVAARHVERIAAGDIPEPIATEYAGDFGRLRDNLNTCSLAVRSLVDDALGLVRAADEGRLSARADATRHHGDFRRIVEGVNRTLDLVIEPIRETSEVLAAMAEGDLRVAAKGSYRGDFESLKSSLNRTLESMDAILAQVSESVGQVAEGSRQVAQASQALSQGATEQASSLEEIGSSMVEVTGRTRRNAERAAEVDRLARKAREDAGRGDGRVKELVAAMADIDASAQEIGKIVKAIDDIAFQINLLALNANVEAARAGKYGKGFAVVAEEVRALAVRSAASVRETTGMVEGAISNIRRGGELVAATAAQLSAIVEGASGVAGLAGEVALASEEQGKGLVQIEAGLTQIDQVTQATTASAEESAAAAEELSSQAAELEKMIGSFKLRERLRSETVNRETVARLLEDAKMEKSALAAAFAAH